LTWLFILVAHVRLYVIYWYYYYDWKFSCDLCKGNYFYYGLLQEDNIMAVHLLGAVMAFGGAGIYCWIQTVISYKMSKLPQSQTWCRHTRVVLSVIHAISFLISILFICQLYHVQYTLVLVAAFCLFVCLFYLLYEPYSSMLTSVDNVAQPQHRLLSTSGAGEETTLNLCCT